MKKPELLAPAGSFEKAKTAYLYGADAIYVGTSNLSLRTRVDIDDNELKKIIDYAHSINKKVSVITQLSTKPPVDRVDRTYFAITKSNSWTEANDMNLFSYFGYSAMIPEMLPSKREVIPRRSTKKSTTIINEDIIHGIPVLRFTFLMIGSRTKESMKESVTGIITEDMVFNRKPASTTARNRII